MPSAQTAAQERGTGLATRLARLSPRAIGAVKAAVFVLALVPFGELFVGALQRTLGTNPTQVVEDTLGTWTLNFLLATLAVTPLRRISGWHWLARLRRMLGLYAFFYALLHFSAYVVLDQGLALADIGEDILKRPFITLGFTCLVLLMPLAATSTDAMVRRLGARRWQAVHRFVYLIAIGAVVHFWWSVKRDITQPVLYALALALLLGYRVASALGRLRVAGIAHKR